MITFNKGTRHLAENALLGQKTRQLTKVPLSKSLTWPMRDLAKLVTLCKRVSVAK